MLDAIGAGLAPRIGDRDWKDHWLDSEDCRQMIAEIEKIKLGTAPQAGEEQKKITLCEYA